MVPNGWNKLSLKKLLTLNYGKSPKEIIDENGAYEIVGTGGITGSTNKYLHSEPSVIIGRKGTIDKPQYLDKPFWAIDTTFYCVPIDNNKVDIKWFYQYSKLINWRNYNEASGVPSLSRETIYAIQVVTPPITEQREIVKILSTWDKAIITTERLIENSTQQKKALMQQLLTGKKRLLDDKGKPFEGEWEEVKLSKWLVEYKEKSTIQDQYDVYTSSRNGLVLQSHYFANSRIAGRDNIGFHVIPPSHITYRSRSDDGFFTFNLFSSDAKGLISNYYPVFTTKGSNIFFIALFEQYRASFGRYSVGTSQKVLSLNALKDILFKIPSIQEQQKIATVLTNADKEIELLEQQLADLQQEKKALMQVLLTGKKRVKLND